MSEEAESRDAVRIDRWLCAARFYKSRSLAADACDGGKVEVNGTDTHPLYRQLKAGQPGLLGTEAIKWNFTKFLIDRRGAVVRRFPPKEIGAALTAAIEKLLGAPQL